MNRIISTIFIATSIFSTAVHADANLAKAKNCMACHSMDKKVVGPAFKDVGAKYASQKGAEDYLAQKITKGSVGVWGAGMPMPPNAVSDKEAHTLAKWILTQK